MPKIKKYVSVHVETYTGERCLTVAQAKEILGWREVKSEEEEPLLVDLDGKKVVCDNNLQNRPFVLSNCLKLKQEILRGKWKLNGEARIIGKSGAVHDGQHTLCGFVLASQEWGKNPEAYPFWKEEPTLQTLIVYGVDDDEETVNTIDTGKSRSLADVIFRSHLFSGMSGKEKRQAASVTEFAIRSLWRRTAVASDLLRTHSESLDFIDRHPSLIECVRHITGEGEQVKKYLPQGQAAALMYLMMVSQSNPKAYREALTPNESLLKTNRKQKSERFWSELVGGAANFIKVREVLAEIVELGCDSNDARQALLVKAWNLFSQEKVMSANLIRPDFLESKQKDEDGHMFKVYTLNECPLLGGIDRGNHPEDEDNSIETQAEEIREEATPSLSEKFEEGEKAWIFDDKGDHWQGKILKLGDPKTDVQVVSGFRGAGLKRTVLTSALRLKQPR